MDKETMGRSLRNAFPVEQGDFEDLLRKLDQVESSQNADGIGNCADGGQLETERR